MICKKCGSELPADSVFCQECGSRFDAEPAPTPTPAADPVTTQDADPVTSGSPSPVSSAAAARPAPSQAEGQAGGSGNKYFTVSAVVTTLMVLGWLIVGFGFLGAIGAASDCKDVLGKSVFDDGCSAGEAVGVFLVVLVVGWLFAIIFFWSGYVLRLLSDIESRLRGVELLEGPPNLPE